MIVTFHILWNIFIIQIRVAKIIIKVVYSITEKRINKMFKSGFIFRAGFPPFSSSPPLEKENVI